MTVEEAVEFGAAEMEANEAKAREIKDSLRGLRSVFEVVRDAGHIGALECQELSAEVDAIGTTFEAYLWRFHARVTKRAMELGIDLPVMRDGGR